MKAGVAQDIASGCSINVAGFYEFVVVGMCTFAEKVRRCGYPVMRSDVGCH